MKTKIFILKLLYWIAMISLTVVFFIFKIVPIAIIIVLGVILYPLILGNYKKEFCAETETMETENDKNMDTKES